MIDNICMVYAHEECGRVSLNTMLVDGLGNISRRNNWTVDILSIELFDSILKQVLGNSKNISKCVIGLPGYVKDSQFVTADFFEVTEEYLKNIGLKYNVEVSLINDVEATMQGYFINEIDDDSKLKIAGLYIPESYPPGSGLIQVEDRIADSVEMAGEVHHMFPNVKWESLMQEKKKVKLSIVEKLCRAVVSMTIPDVLVVYSEFLKDEDLVNIFDSFEIAPKEVVVKSNVSEDFESGLAFLSRIQLNEVYYEN